MSRFLAMLAAVVLLSCGADPMSGVSFACDPDGPTTCASGWVCASVTAGLSYKGVCVRVGEMPDNGFVDDAGVDDNGGPLDHGSPDPAPETETLDSGGEIPDGDVSDALDIMDVLETDVETDDIDDAGDPGSDPSFEVCEADCSGKSCGDDDQCGGTCTGCPANATCNPETWQCDCPGPWCGGSCCGSGQACGAEDACVGACVPDCDGKECGSDGCPGGGTCGTCDDGDPCTTGTCDPVGACMQEPTACDCDLDGDEVSNNHQDCPFVENPDNCPNVPNPGQADLDGDGVGDACDCDIDGDGDPNANPGCPALERYDCAPYNAAISRLADEKCSGQDDNCNGLTDEEGAIGCEMHYRDEDGDGYGAPEGGRCLCGSEGHYKVLNSGDCCDMDAGARPLQSQFFTSPNNCGTWDYNCDKLATLQYTAIGGCSNWPGCALTVGWEGTILPDCGDSMQYINGGCGYDLIFCGQVMTVTRTQGCR